MPRVELERDQYVVEYSRSVSVRLCLTYDNTGGGHTYFEVQVSLSSSQGMYLPNISSVCVVCVSVLSMYVCVVLFGVCVCLTYIC